MTWNMHSMYVSPFIQITTSNMHSMHLCRDIRFITWNMDSMCVARYIRLTTWNMDWMYRSWNIQIWGRKLIGSPNPLFHNCKIDECVFIVVISELYGKNNWKWKSLCGRRALNSFARSRFVWVSMCCLFNSPWESFIGAEPLLGICFVFARLSDTRKMLWKYRCASESLENVLKSIAVYLKSPRRVCFPLYSI